jgi:hypothetical protein
MGTMLASEVPRRNSLPRHDGGMDNDEAGRKLRSVRDDFPPISDRRITLILVKPDPEVPARFGVSPAHKRELLEAAKEGDELVAVWSGAKESHAFKVTPESAKLWAASLVAF